MSVNGNGPAVFPDGTVEENPALGVNAMLRAIRVCAENAASDDSAAECKDYAAAALSFAQTLALLNPTTDTQGIPLDHHVQMQHDKADRELEKVKEQAKSQPPTPSKTVTAKRAGGTTTYKVDG